MGQAPDELMSREEVTREEVSRAGLPPTEGGTPAHEQENPSIPELRTDIAQTRAEMSGTLDALQEKLTPGALAGEAKAKLRAKAGEGLGRARTLVRERFQPQVQQGVRQATTGIALVRAQGQQLVARARQSWRENPVGFVVVLAAIGTVLSVVGVAVARALNRTTDA